MQELEAHGSPEAVGAAPGAGCYLTPRRVSRGWAQIHQKGSAARACYGGGPDRRWHKGSEASKGKTRPRFCCISKHLGRPGLGRVRRNGGLGDGGQRSRLLSLRAAEDRECWWAGSAIPAASWTMGLRNRGIAESRYCVIAIRSTPASTCARHVPQVGVGMDAFRQGCFIPPIQGSIIQNDRDISFGTCVAALFARCLRGNPAVCEFPMQDSFQDCCGWSGFPLKMSEHGDPVAPPLLRSVHLCTAEPQCLGLN